MNISVPQSFLEQIQDWMIENDYECGPEGGVIFDRITMLIKTEELNQEITRSTI